jgi:RIO-like serine/threonine protein kinase
MRALGREELPARLEVSGRTLRRLATAKHDFWAATGFYEDAAGGRAVLKVYRTARFAGTPLRWLGRWQCGREFAFYRHLAGVSCVPALLGRISDTAYLRAFVAGNPLSRERPVPDGFWPALDTAMREVHRRGVVYVDSNKPENILVGEDGRPYLIDFQIAWRCGRRADHALGRWWLARLQREDLYHVLKHKRRFARDSMTPTELASVRRRSVLIRAHRVINWPYRMVRRPLFRWLRRTGRVLPSGSN